MHTVFRTTLLMCIAGQPQFAHLRLTKEALDEWYEWFPTGKTSRVADPPRQKESSSLRSAMPGARFMTWSTQTTPLTEALSKLRHDHLFWQREVYEYCNNTPEPPPRGWARTGASPGPKSGKPSGTSLQKAARTEVGKGPRPTFERRQGPKGQRQGPVARRLGPSRTPKRGKHFAETTT